jgi:heat-inducible transcriptional repressor
MDSANISERILDERESSILRAIVYEYISTGKPVGSRSFVQKYSLTLSPATLRNIMYDLEQMDYLMQPHTSAGRTPTDKGYRYYVNSLLDSYEFKRSDEIQVKEDAIRKELQMDRVFIAITRMLSSVSRYAGVIMTPKPDYTVVKRIDLIPLESNDIIFVLVTRHGVVINKKVTISASITQDHLYEFSRYLTNELCGFQVNEIRDAIFKRLREEKVSGIDKDMALDIAELALGGNEESELYIDGIENLLRIPEMVEENRLNSLLNIIEEKNILREMLVSTMEGEGVKILIGSEILSNKVSGCSMVSTSYKKGNIRVGVLGVFGPTRMDYEKVVPLVDYTGRIVSDFFTKMTK